MPKYPNADLCKREVERGRMCYVGPIFIYFLKGIFWPACQTKQETEGRTLAAFSRIHCQFNYFPLTICFSLLFKI